MTNLLALTAMTLVAPQTPSINEYLSKNLEDASMVAVIVKGDQRELEKINHDFGQSYRFESSKIMFKEPFKIRVEATTEDTSVLYILNGPTQVFRIPKAKLNTKQDISKSPGRRQTCMDFGVLTTSLFNGTFFTAKFVRNDRATGNVVFDINFIPSLNDTSHHRVWIDPDKKYITKREWYNQYNRQLATFFYETPKQYDGVWMPTQLRVMNVDNKVAGITRYDSIKVNTGLAESLFSVN